MRSFFYAGFDKMLHSPKPQDELLAMPFCASVFLCLVNWAPVIISALFKTTRWAGGSPWKPCKQCKQYKVVQALLYKENSQFLLSWQCNCISSAICTSCAICASCTICAIQWICASCAICTSCARSLRSCVSARARPQVGLGPLALRVGGSVVPNSDLLLIWIGCLAGCLVVAGRGLRFSKLDGDPVGSAQFWFAFEF